MRLKFSFAVAITVVLSGCGNKPQTATGEPGLQETQAWMNSFVANRGAGATYAGGSCSGAVTWSENGRPYYTFSFSGSAQEFVETRILGYFPKNDEFGLGDRHALGLEQQIAEVFVAAAPSKKGSDVAVDGFHDSEAYFGAAVVEDPVQMV